VNGSATAIWIIVAVAVAGLVIWLGSVALAARKPPGAGLCAKTPTGKNSGKPPS
jgi:hypothetical protein